MNRRTIGATEGGNESYHIPTNPQLYMSIGAVPLFRHVHGVNGCVYVVHICVRIFVTS